MAAEPICKEMVTQGAKAPSSGKWATSFSGRANAVERKSRMNQQVASINHDFILLLVACMLHFNLGFRNKEVSPATSSWNTKMMGTP